MWLWWLSLTVWAGPADDARALLGAGWIEAAAVTLDPWLGEDAEAALLRFELADRVGDHDSLQPVLTPPLVAKLPWSTRDRAHLVLGRTHIETGDLRAAARHLSQVYPDAEVYSDALLLLGDIEAARGNLLTAVRTWRQATFHGAPSQALLRIGQVYEQLGRPANAATYFEMIPEQTPEWAHSRVPLARDLLAAGSEAEALSALLALNQSWVRAHTWSPEAEFLRARIWAVRCRPDRAEEIAQSARDELAPVLVAFTLAMNSGGSPNDLWDDHFGHGAAGGLPARWYRTFLAGRDVAPLFARLKRIDRELVMLSLEGHDALVAALAARRGRTVHALGIRLAAAIARDRSAIAPWLEDVEEARDGWVDAEASSGGTRRTEVGRDSPLRMRSPAQCTPRRSRGFWRR
ncbi:MAG: tetratricopeptide repeat protein [Myxococcales bacterium]|nr:tetratricopeptide repeat protein [Myxococcales bacterium]